MSNLLTARESQVAELIAWGAAKKEVPGLLKRLHGGREIAVHTVENILRGIYRKIGISKATELSVWWFCKFCGVDGSASPLKRAREMAMSAMLMAVMLFQLANSDISAIRPARVRVRIERQESSLWRK